MYVPPGRTIEAFDAPLVREYRDFVRCNRDEIAVCLGATPQDLSGDYSGMNYSVSRANAELSTRFIRSSMTTLRSAGPCAPTRLPVIPPNA